MKWLSAFLFLSFACAWLGFVCTHRVTAAHLTPATRQTAEAAYAQNADALYAMAKIPDHKALRQHAWQMLVGQLDRSNPKWEHTPWLGRCQMGLSNSWNCPPSTNEDHPQSPITLQKPTQTQLMDTAHFLPDNSLQLSSVLYSPAAQRFIRGTNDLTKIATWVSAPKHDPVLPPLKGDERLVKEIWELVWACPTGPSCTQTIELWDRAPNEASHPAAPGNASNDVHAPEGSYVHTQAQIIPDPNMKCDKSTYDGAQSSPIPLRCFHFIAFAPKTLPITTPTGEANPTVPQTQWSYTILVGFHVMTGEVPDWSWSTFWWTRDPSSEPLANDKPAELNNSREPWRFYAMNTFINPNPGAAYNKPHDPTIFNPFLEGKITDGQVSNCLFCHSHATFRYDKYVEKVPWIASDLQKLEIPAGQPGPNNFFKGAVRTHFSWSVAMNLDPNVDTHPLDGTKKQSSAATENALD